MNALHYGGISVEVTVNGRPVRTYAHQGRYYFESRKDSQYEIVVRNNNFHRVEVVASVDGLSVMNGELASKSDSGYIVNGYDKLVIKGYRYSTDAVGAFKFAEKSESYAASKHVAGNTGLIAIAVFAEYVRPYIPTVTYTSPVGPWSGNWGSGLIGSSITGTLGCNGSNGVRLSDTISCYHASTEKDTVLTAMNCSSSTLLRSIEPTVEAAHGTAWGAKLDDRVQYVNWERGVEIYSTELNYNSRENLIALGVPVVPMKLAVAPVGFPRDFATPPNGWGG